MTGAKRNHAGKWPMQRGVSLVELMVAMVIGLVLTAGVIQLFIGNKKTYRFEDAMARVQESARFALDAMASEIRMAGNLGCTSYLERENPVGTGALAQGQYRVTLNNPGNYVWNFQAAVQGHDWNGAGWTPALPGSVTSLNDSDVITIRSTQGVPITVSSHGAAPGTANLVLNRTDGLDDDNILLVGNCAAATIFQATDVSHATNTIQHAQGAGTPGNATDALGQDYTDSSLIQVSSSTYYVDTGADGTPSLFRQTNMLAAQEVVSGVERMQITYGLDNDSDRIADVYQDGNQVNAAAAWPDVVSVRLSLLMQSDQDNITDVAQAIDFDGVTINPGDRRLRQVYNMTVSLRNRTP